MEIGIVGGTGAFGSALAARLARAGHSVIIGSRAPAAAENTVTDLITRWGLPSSTLASGDNSHAAAAQVVVLSVPASAAASVAGPLMETLAGKLVITPINHLRREATERVPVRETTSVAEQLQGLLPGSFVATAFNHLPALVAGDPEATLDADVLVCANDESARRTATEIIDSIAGLRSLHAGSLALASAVESFTAVLSNVDVRHHAQASIRLVDQGRR